MNADRIDTRARRPQGSTIPLLVAVLLAGSSTVLQEHQGAGAPLPLHHDGPGATGKRWEDSRPLAIGRSIDPNDIIGPAGVGVERAISGQQFIPYTIRFENASNATAPAQQVVVSDVLNASTLDPSTVALGAITFGSVHIVPPPGVITFATQVDLRPGSNLLVNINVAFDPPTHVLAWHFASIDPATGQPPADPLVGFLPPNVTPPEGEGSVSFIVMPHAGLATGTQIRNSASIGFDSNPPETTPEWFNTVDNTPPASHVLPLPANSDLPSISIQWVADGAPADLRDFSVYVSEDGGPYRAWRVNTIATTDTLVPPGNHVFHQYSFFSLARDMVGNVETPPASADASTQSTTVVADSNPLALTLEGARPNPARDALQVWFTLPNREPATLDLVDVTGRTVLRRDLSALGPGRHKLSLGTSVPLRPGLYYLRLAQRGHSLTASMTLVR